MDNGIGVEPRLELDAVGFDNAPVDEVIYAYGDAHDTSIYHRYGNSPALLCSDSIDSSREISSIR